MNNLRIAVLTVLVFLWTVCRQDAPSAIVSRNLYAGFVLGVLLRRKLIFETHQLEHGLRRFLQRGVIASRSVTTVVISLALQELLAKEYRTEPKRFVVLCDAASASTTRLSAKGREEGRRSLTSQVDLSCYQKVAGYFGHLYSGRGIEIICGLAERHPDIGFLIFGGDQQGIARLRTNRTASNLHIMGHILPSQATRVMALMDVLLMPYQKSVSIGNKKSDTATYMSPMKMFEYMAAGVPIIASKLPVLQEVLRDGHNCLMATPHDLADWSACLERICKHPEQAEKMAATGHAECTSDYSWTSRARKMLELVRP